MPYLDTKTRFAIVGTTNEWCPGALLETLKKEPTKHIDSMKKDSQLYGKFSNQELPPFLVRKTKVFLPKLDGVSKEDSEFTNYFERLCNCNVIEVADADWLWMKQVMEDYMPQAPSPN